MRVQSFFLSIAIVLFSVLSLNAQDDQRKLDPFDEVVITGKIRVELIKANSESADIYTYDGVSPDKVNINIRGRQLRIGLLDGLIKGHEPVYIKLYYTQLTGLKAKAGAQLKSEGTITTSNLRIKAGSGAQIYLEVEADVVEAASSEGGQLEIYGDTNQFDAGATTGGHIYANRLIAARTYVRAGTGGQVKVHATEYLDAVANTGGNIEYSGNPEKKHTKTILGGNIDRY